MKLKRSILVTLVVMAMIFSVGLVLADVRNVPVPYATVQDAINAANPGDTVQVASGTYYHSSTLSVNKSLTIQGAGRDATELGKAGAASTYDISVNITASSVTIKDLTLGGWQTPVTYRGYVVQTNASDTTINNVRFKNDVRSFIVMLHSNNLEVSDCLFTGFLGRGGIRGDGENLLITRNVFLEDHYRWGPVYIEYSNPWSGTISYNYFANGVKAGDFQEGGANLNTITVWNSNLSAAGLAIIHNTFEWKDKDTTNALGDYSQAQAIYYDPFLTIPDDKVIVKDNIITGYEYTAPSGGGPIWRPSEGQFNGALEFDGADDYAWFQDASFDVGSTGTLSLWFNLNATGKRHELLKGPGNGFEFQVRHSNDVFFYTNLSDGDNTLVWSSDTVTAGTWRHLAFTWSKPSSEGHIYLNGTEVSYRAGYDPDLSGGWNNVVNTVNGLMNIGRDPGDGSRCFDGLLDDIAFYNDVLSQSERDDIRNNGVSAHADLVAHWNLDQSSGIVATGNSGTSIDLNLFQVETYAVKGPSNMVVSNNLFYSNSNNSDPAGDGSNKDADPLFKRIGPDTEDYYELQPGSPALRAASDGTNIGANQEAPAGEVWVDDDYTSATPGWGATHFDVIQDAVNVVDTTGTVHIYDGIYREKVLVNKGITISGDGLPFLDGEGGDTGLMIAAEDVSISGLALHSYDVAIDLSSTGSASLNGCYLFKAGTYGLRNQNSGGTVEATFNWWGDNSGPSVVGSGVALGGNVHYDPWIGKTGDPHGAEDFAPGATGTAATGTGKTEIEIKINTCPDTSLILVSEEDGIPQGKTGFADAKAIDRRAIATPYYLTDGQFLATLKFYYTSQDLIDAGIPDGSWLSIRTWDQGGASWVYAVYKNIGPSTNIHVGDTPPDAVLGHYGTYTTGGYCWANIDHLSQFAAGQDPTVPVELSVFSLE